MQHNSSERKTGSHRTFIAALDLLDSSASRARPLGRGVPLLRAGCDGLRPVSRSPRSSSRPSRARSANAARRDRRCSNGKPRALHQGDAAPRPRLCAAQGRGPARRPRRAGGRRRRSVRAGAVLVVEQEVGDVGIGLALPAEGRGLAVARHELDVVAERPQALADRGTGAARDCRAGNPCGRSSPGTARRPRRRSVPACARTRHGPAYGRGSARHRRSGCRGVTVSPFSSQRSGTNGL